MEDYKKLYDDLIEMRRLNVISKKDCYCEEHHILPKCLGGTDDKDNLIMLTASEHFMAHYYLVNMYEKGSYERSQLVSAYVIMNVKSNKNVGREVNALLYEELRKEHSEAMSVLMKGKSKGKQNSQYGTMWITDGVNNKKIQKDETIPDGWRKGRKVNVSDNFKKSTFGKVFITNGKENKKINKNDNIPEGWKKGRTNFKKMVSGKENKNYNNICITNGKKDKRIHKDDKIPEGWFIGSIQSNYKWITNGIKEKRILKEDKIPEGWERGQLKSGKIMWITNGIIDKMVNKTYVIKDGWRKGRK